MRASLLASSLCAVTGQELFLARPNVTGATLSPYEHNPILIATTSASLQGQGNCYAPDVHMLDGSPRFVMWYGCQGGDGHDRIYWSWSDNGLDWQKFPSDADPQPALDRGSSNHVNDPSVVQSGSTWMMYYTDASNAEDDRIWLAESSHFNGFSKTALALDVGPSGSWDSFKVGRPSVIIEDGVFKMWYDGNDGTTRSMGYASSKDGRIWTKHASNPVLVNAGAADVKRIGDKYVMVFEGGDGVHRATSPDGLSWTVDQTLFVPKSGQPYDLYGTVTPFLLVDNDALHSVWYAGCTVSSWNKNQIAAAFAAEPAATGGCVACTSPGLGCPSSCSANSGGRQAGGTCAAPGSADPGSCCSCFDDGCGACSTGCHEACTAAGHDGGFCAVPGSTDPGACCGCF